MSKPSPFDAVKAINEKRPLHDLSGYNPFLTNRCFAMHMDTVLLSEEMNQAHNLSPHLQYDFFYYAVRKGRRFGFPPKPDHDDFVDIVMDYFEYSRQKAIEALRILSPQEVMRMKSSMVKGGIS